MTKQALGLTSALVLAAMGAGCAGQEVACTCYRSPFGDESPETFSAASASVCEALAEGSEEFAYCRADEALSSALPLDPAAASVPPGQNGMPWEAPLPARDWSQGAWRSP
jgi:hypothetical protein